MADDTPISRIKAAIAGKPCANTRVQTGEDAQGNPIYGTMTPLAKVQAGDVLAVADAIPAAQRTATVKALRKGSTGWPAEQIVQPQCQCLTELVAVYEAADPPVQAPAPPGP